MKFERGQFVQQKRRNHQMNAWRCAGVVTQIFPDGTPVVAWLEFDRSAYQLELPRSTLAMGVEAEHVLPLDPEKCIVPIADSVHAEIMKRLLS